MGGWIRIKNNLIDIWKDIEDDSVLQDFHFNQEGKILKYKEKRESANNFTKYYYELDIDKSGFYNNEVHELSELEVKVLEVLNEV